MSEVVIGAMGTLLPKLADLITKEYNLQTGVRGEIMFLKAEMESMKTALLRISEAPIDQPPDIQVKLWAKAVRDLSYDLEDSIDKFMVRIETHGQPEKSQSFREYIDKSLGLLTKGKIRHKNGVNIKDIKSRIKEVSERHHRYKVDSVAAARSTGPIVGIMVPKFSCHVGEPGTMYDDDCDGPVANMETILQDESSRPHGILLQDLKEITHNFSNERIIGQGGFGVVYKGALRNGETIAVKRIMSSLMPDLQKKFESEMDHLMMLKHPNIVRCVGYCYETRYERLCYNGKYVFAEMAERLLCLEYMPKGSLDKYLSDESSGLDWSTRYNIIKGICYGLCHLHEEIGMPIIHLDLKPPNILLDDGMEPKITDFGLARLLDQQKTICTSSRDGTFGYMAPEFLHGGIVTTKSDIFSLGVIIMEVVTGHRDYPDVTRTPPKDYIEHALEKWRTVLQRSQVHESLERDCEQIKRCLQVGLMCVNPDRTKRPPIVNIINMLQGSESVDSVTFAKPSGQLVDTFRLSTLYRKAHELVGTYEKSLEVINMLKEGDKVSKNQMKVVCIVGSGGLGKTTLANAVYEKLKAQFDIEKWNFQFECTAFVCVHIDPNMEKIFKSLLRQLDKHKYKSINEATCGEVQLICEIRTFLANKRYLIVIDDIWDTCVWENIKYALAGNEHGSRVITTTRILDVAQQAGNVYLLEPLSIADSRKLFYQRIYETENQSLSNKLVELSEKILGRCGGVPLAIIAIGSLLSSKKGRAHTHEHWSMVYQSMDMGLDFSHDDVKKMRRILSVSYYDLPPHLKTCLLHVSSYLKGYEIETEQLVWKWVGEGFVEKEPGRSLYEVGEGYVDELINTSLVQPVQFDNANKVRSCRVHDMVHDLITSLSNEENFLITVGSQHPMYLPSKTRRLSVQINIEEVANQLLSINLSHVRSLVVSNPAFSLLPTLSSFPVLRVLDLTDCEQVDNNRWKHVCNLFHLRYLSLKGTSITKIPKEIRNLQFLQVLDIRSTKIEEEMPATFIELTRLLLVHMLGSISCAVPKWMCSMSFLFSLSITLKTLGEEDLQVLGSLPSLMYLHILVEKLTQGREKRLVTDSGSSFMCLKSFIVMSDTMELKFASGAMQSLQTLQLHFYDVQDTLVQFGDFVLGLENLSSLECIEVTFRKGHTEKINSVTKAMEEEIDMNRNMPKLKVVALEALEEKMRASIEEYRAVSVALDERF